MEFSYNSFIIMLCLSCLNVVCLPQPLEDIDTSKPKNILVFGGNGFLGAPTVEKLIKAGHDCTILNRGNWYWDTANTVKPFVRHIKFDRMQSLSKCTELVELLKTKRFDVVIDFSAYQSFVVSGAVELLKEHAGLYIYISSDSVYEVCLKNHSHSTVESDSVRPTDLKEREKLTKKDNYGNNKLEIEEVLEKQRQNGGIPYISLRLPDIAGPRDNTNRWWVYQLWIRLEKYVDRPVSTPVNLNERLMSFVYSLDVADLIVNMTNARPSPLVLDQAYNLAFTETFTLEQLLTDIKTILKTENVTIGIDKNPNAMWLFPSVTLGPVNITKATNMLNWTPTPWKQALRDTVLFYETALVKYEFDIHRRYIIRTFQQYFPHRADNIVIGIKKEYSVDSLGARTKDEL